MKSKLFPIGHYVITFLLIFGFGFLPPFGQMSAYGMGVLGTFIGAIYGWTTIGMIWPSLMALCGLGMYVDMGSMLQSSFGNPAVAALFPLFPMMALLSELHITEYVANKFFTNRLSLGRPWVAIFILFLGAFVCASVNSILVIIIFAVFVVDLCKNLGIAPYSKLPSTLLLGLSYAIMNGQIIFPFLGTGLTFTAAYGSMFQTTLPFAQYMLFIIPMGIVMLLVYVLIMRFVFRVDVSPLANMTEEMLGEKAVMTRDQKLVSIFFVAYILIMTISSLLPKAWLIAIVLNTMTIFGVSVLITGLLMLIKNSSGQPLLDFALMAAKGMAWEPILLTAYIMAISAFLTTAETGFGATLSALLAPTTALPPLLFVLAIMLFATIVTNVANNLILTIIIMPIISSFAGQVGLNAVGLILMLFVTTQMALATPGASPITGIVFSQTSMVKAGDLSKYALMAIPILFVFCMLFGYVYMNIIF